MVETAVELLLVEGGPKPINAFANDANLQLMDGIRASLALNAGGSWSCKANQRFNLKPGKSAWLV